MYYKHLYILKYMKLFTFICLLWFFDEYYLVNGYIVHIGFGDIVSQEVFSVKVCQQMKLSANR